MVCMSLMRPANHRDGNTGLSLERLGGKNMEPLSEKVEFVGVTTLINGESS